MADAAASLAMLIDMGFPAEAARRAVASTSSLDAAVDWLEAYPDGVAPVPTPATSSASATATLPRRRTPPASPSHGLENGRGRGRGRGRRRGGRNGVIGDEKMADAGEDELQTGIIVKYDDSKGFGFIQRTYGPNAFFHVSNVIKDTETMHSGGPPVAVGDKVEYKYGPYGKQGMMSAVAVRVIQSHASHGGNKAQLQSTITKQRTEYESKQRSWGRVRAIHTSVNTGFITIGNKNQDILFRLNDVVATTDLAVDLIVEFDVQPDPVAKAMAVNVTPINSLLTRDQILPIHRASLPPDITSIPHLPPIHPMILWSHSHLEETRHIELKSNASHFKVIAEKYVNAFLNAGISGMICFGIEDDGTVTGCWNCNQKTRDDIRLSHDQILRLSNPIISPSTCSLALIPIFEQLYDMYRIIPDVYVIAIITRHTTGHVLYQTSGHGADGAAAWIRREASTTRMTPSEIASLYQSHADAKLDQAKAEMTANMMKLLESYKARGNMDADQRIQTLQHHTQLQPHFQAAAPSSSPSQAPHTQIPSQSSSIDDNTLSTFLAMGFARDIIMRVMDELTHEGENVEPEMILDRLMTLEEEKSSSQQQQQQSSHQQTHQQTHHAQHQQQQPYAQQHQSPFQQQQPSNAQPYPTVPVTQYNNTTSSSTSTPSFQRLPAGTHHSATATVTVTTPSLSIPARNPSPAISTSTTIPARAPSSSPVTSTSTIPVNDLPHPVVFPAPVPIQSASTGITCPLCSFWFPNASNVSETHIDACVKRAYIAHQHEPTRSQPSTYQPPPPPADELLPCEICDAMIPINQFDQHQRDCAKRRR